MDTKRFVIGTIVGAITLFLVGWVIFTWLFGGFYAANRGIATGVDRDAAIWWAVVISQICYAALIVYVLGRRPGAMSIMAGATVGATVGLLFWLAVDFGFYAYTNLGTLAGTIVDPLLETVHAGITGAVIGAVLAKVPISAGGKVITTAG